FCETDDDTVDCGLSWCLGVPGEGSMREFDDESCVENGAEQSWWLVSLSDGIGGDIGKFPSARFVQGEGLGVPTSDVIKSRNVFSSPQCAELFCLLCVTGGMPQEGRVTKDKGVTFR